MLTITSKAFFDQLQVDDDEIVLNGPPSSLKGQLILNNETDERISVRSLPIQHLHKNMTLNSAGESALNLLVRLRSKEKRTETITHEISAQTPPGIYESLLLAGGKKRKLKLVVQPAVKIDLYPMFFTFQDTAPGTKHTALITLYNAGNMPFQVPEVKHVTTLDMDYLCRATSLAIKGKGAAEGFTGFMDEITRNIQANLTDAVTAVLKEGGQVLQPGETKIIQLEIILPKNTDAARDYAGAIRIWDQVISYTIKSYTETPKTKK